jgi:hypothetical protein
VDIELADDGTAGDFRLIRVQPVWLKRGQGCKPSCSKEVS